MIKTLIFLVNKLNANHIKWFLGGSGALMIHGVQVTPHDLDFFIDSTDFDKVVQIFFAPQINSLNKNNRPIRNFRLNQDVEVEFYEKDLSQKNLVRVDYQGLSVPVNPLEVELGYYQARSGKEETVKLIQARLLEINQP